VQSRRRDATRRRIRWADASHQLHHDPNPANVKFLPRQRVDNAWRKLPEFGRRRAVGRGQSEDALVLADHLHLPRKLGR
jgi:hypothetical protein